MWSPRPCHVNPIVSCASKFRSRAQDGETRAKCQIHTFYKFFFIAFFPFRFVVLCVRPCRSILVSECKCRFSPLKARYIRTENEIPVSVKNTLMPCIDAATARLMRVREAGVCGSWTIRFRAFFSSEKQAKLVFCCTEYKILRSNSRPRSTLTKKISDGLSPLLCPYGGSAQKKIGLDLRLKLIFYELKIYFWAVILKLKFTVVLVSEIEI